MLRKTDSFSSSAMTDCRNTFLGSGFNYMNNDLPQECSHLLVSTAWQTYTYLSRNKVHWTQWELLLNRQYKIILLLLQSMDFCHHFHFQVPNNLFEADPWILLTTPGLETMSYSWTSLFTVCLIRQQNMIFKQCPNTWISCGLHFSIS